MATGAQSEKGYGIPRRDPGNNPSTMGIQMSDYDIWRLQTPEEFFGAVELTCEECGDDFDSYDPDRTQCQDCDE